MRGKAVHYLAGCLVVAALAVSCQDKTVPPDTESRSAGKGGKSGKGVASSTGGSSSEINVTGDGSCDSPIALSGSRNLTDQSTVDAGSNLSAQDPSCIGSATDGAERIYKVKLSSKSPNQLIVTVIPDAAPQPDAFDPVVYVTTGCEALPLCVAAKDARGGGSQEKLVYTNTTGADQDLYIVVDSYSFQSSGGKYKMNVELVDP